MNRTTSASGKRALALKKIIAACSYSSWTQRLVRFPPLAWAIRILASALARRQISLEHPAQAVPAEANATGLEGALHAIAHDVVHALGYVGAMVATYEQGDTLPVRAFFVDPSIATLEQIRRWEAVVSEFLPAGRRVSITDPTIARVQVYDDRYRDNLSVRAFHAGGPQVSPELYSLFTPLAPATAKPVVDGIQAALGIEQVIAMPFFLETTERGHRSREFVGNLFAAKSGPISPQDQRILAAFARQAAAALESEQRRLQVQVAQQLVFAVHANLEDESRILQRIAEGIVCDLNYVGAMVATYEADGSLPVRALMIDPAVASAEQIRRWEEAVSRYTASDHPLHLTDSTVARVLVHDEAYADNLSVRAFKAGEPVTDSSLYALLTPVAPLPARPVVDDIQSALGIEQVIAVPFFTETLNAGERTREFVGNLFAATRSRQFRAREIGLLKAFGDHAAAGIYNARLYDKAEQRRQAAQVFGKIAFNAAAYVHDLRNHIGAFQLHLRLLQLWDQLPPAERRQLLASNQSIIDRLQEAVQILDYLHEPWHQVKEIPTDVNRCIAQAMAKVIKAPDLAAAVEGVEIESQFAPQLPPVQTAPEMLIETFKVLLKNALEAIEEKGEPGTLQVQTRAGGGHRAWIEVTVQDNGIGIKATDLAHIFEMGWSSKKDKGMGFGLFWVKDYLEGLGGSIQVNSTWQAGTTVRLHLPAALPEGSAPLKDTPSSFP